MDEHSNTPKDDLPVNTPDWSLYNDEGEATGEHASADASITAPNPLSQHAPVESPTAEIPASAGGITPPPPPGSSSTPGAGSFMPPPYQPAVAQKQKSGRKGIAAAVAVGAAAAFIGVGLGHYAWGGSPTTTVSQPAASSPFGSGSNGGSSSDPFGSPISGGSGSSSQGSSSSNTASSAAVNAVASKVDPGLVDINTNLGYESASAAGTGIVLTSNGTILTNNHVISGATQITATDIGNGKTYKAAVVGYDRSHDVAVIQLQNASGLTTASLGNSSSASVGQSVIGIGNAGGAGGTPSTAAGTITALNQSITASDESSSTSEQLSGLIQTNAPIQPGDSGGPLVTMRGQVIGMDTAASSNYQFSGSSADASQGFSIPINTALSIAHQITGGHASNTVHLGATGFMGVQVQSASASTNPFGDQGGSSQGSTNGVSVVGTVSGSPAAQAGLGQGDTITAVNGTTITTPEQLTTIINRFHPGNQVTLTWQDSSGATHNSTLRLAPGPAA